VEVSERDLVLCAEAVIDLGDHLILIESLRDREGEEVALIGGRKEIPDKAPGEGPDAAGGDAVARDVLPGGIRVRQRAGQSGKIAGALRRVQGAIAALPRAAALLGALVAEKKERFVLLDGTAD